MSEILRAQLSKYIEITDCEFEYILNHFTYKKLKKHQFLLQEDQLATDDYFLLSGCVKSYYTDTSGKMHILLFAVQGW
ncbi:hypothetical protein MKJ01_02500 [Chryseobacterium sp. SSA4.19]|uniref:hypothetical protein n=1 Tax=Chryseobacterium sp. SSA4.19 TaxID=2919915 RepID=UPI001F4ED4BF|nr:hypothetical protein [Chryseobacterium sp. SSA4.19]MCJ8152631.1 hypothetical protein [Chryseobacterium sp. SSA4.19]